MVASFRALAVLILGSALALTAPAQASPPDPQPRPSPGDCVAGQIYYGAVPPGGEQAPVLVFVHGLAGLAKDWWTDQTSAGLNDMYLQAYNAGYRTAFVSTNIDREQALFCRVERRPALGVSATGEVLSRQIRLIAEQYQVDQVDIIAHSKGGVDTQSALIEWGAWPYVRHVFTLSSPHQGSILADLLWSPDGFWLSILLGQRDAATYSLRTDQMSAFRQMADASTLDDAVRYYSGAGNFWQSPDSIYELTGAWLQEQPDGGDNDGVVTVASTALHGATPLFVQPWNHAEITLGHNSFPYIDAILRGSQPATPSPSPTSTATSTATASPTSTPSPSPTSTATTIPGSTDAARLHLPLLARGRAPGIQAASGQAALSSEAGLILRGGRLNTTAELQFPIEPFARSARFTLLASQPLKARLLGPDGESIEIGLRQYHEQPMLAGAMGGSVLARQPAAGSWRLRLEGPPGAAYLLLVDIDSPLQVALSQTGADVQATVQGQGRPEVRRVELRALPDRAGPRQGQPLVIVGGPRLRLGGPRSEPYTASVAVYGETADGHSFERTFVRALP